MRTKTLQTSFHLPREACRFFGLQLRQEPEASQISMTTRNLSLSRLSSQLPASFSPSIMIFEVRATAATTKKPSYSDLKHVASPISEVRQSSIRPQNPGRCQCLHGQATSQASHSIPIPPCLFPGSRLSQACSPILHVLPSKGKILVYSSSSKSE